MEVSKTHLVLFVADLFHPVNDLAVETFLNGDVRHGSGRRSPMPMLLPRREPNHITRSDFLDGAALALRPPAPSRHDQGLPQRMSVPGSTRTWLEGDTCAAGACGRVRLEEGVNAHSASDYSPCVNAGASTGQA